MNQELMAFDAHTHFRTGSRMTPAVVHSALENALWNMPGKTVGLVLANAGDYRFYEAIDTIQGSLNCKVEDLRRGALVTIPAGYFSDIETDRQILIINGQEVFSNEGDILLLATPYKSRVPDNQTPLGVFEAAKDLEAVTVIPHPFSRLGGLFRNIRSTKGRESIIENCDGIEIWNSQSSQGSNEEALDFYYRLRKRTLDIGATIGSDGHSAGEVGSSYSVIPMPDISSPETLRDSIEQGIKSGSPLLHARFKRNYFGSLRHAVALAVYNGLGFHTTLNKGRKWLE
ncbi:PHP-associated [uncultured archaeon]|nr:PHP-associated [uncultured archaeon]